MSKYTHGFCIWFQAPAGHHDRWAGTGVWPASDSELPIWCREDRDNGVVDETFRTSKQSDILSSKTIVLRATIFRLWWVEFGRFMETRLWSIKYSISQFVKGNQASTWKEAKVELAQLEKWK